MSSKHKLLLLGCLVALAVASVVWRPAAFQDQDPVRSTYSAAPEGCKALYLVLEALQLPVTRLGLPLTRLQERRAALVIIGPHQVPFRKREVDRLTQWVEKGNRLILFSGGPRPMQRVALGAAIDKRPSKDKSTDSLHRGFGLSLKSFPGETRTEVEVASPWLYGIGKISASGKTRWHEPDAEWQEIVGDKAGPIIVARKLGHGEILAVADSSLISNRYVGLEQNVRVLPALVLEKERPNEILFDEYHHGHMLAESFWTYVGGSGFAGVLFQVGVGCLLLFYSRRARYAGRFRSLSRPTGRSSLEYVESMANLFDTCKAGSVALEAIFSRFLGRLSRTSGIPRKRLEANAADDASLYAPGGLDLTRLVHQCREAVNSGTDAARAVELARNLAEANRRLRPIRDLRALLERS